MIDPRSLVIEVKTNSNASKIYFHFRVSLSGSSLSRFRSYCRLVLCFLFDCGLLQNYEIGRFCFELLAIS